MNWEILLFIPFFFTMEVVPNIFKKFILENPLKCGKMLKKKLQKNLEVAQSVSNVSDIGFRRWN